MKNAIQKLSAIVLIFTISCLPMAAHAAPNEPEPVTESVETAVVAVIGESDGATATVVSEKPDLNPPLWYQWGFESLEDLLEEYGMSEDEYYRIVADMLNWEQEYAKLREELIVSYGGTVGITNVMVNGKMAGFSTAVPEQTGGTTYAPARPVLELIGADVAFDTKTQTVTADFGDTTLLLTIGETDMTVLSGGEDIAADIKAAPYLKGDSAYIPVRAVFEALGFDVSWDSYYNTVVIIDKAAIIAEIDKSFTTANKLMAMRLPVLEGAQKTTVDASLDVTMFDTIDGDKTTSATASVVCLYDDEGFCLSAEYDITALIRLIYADLYSYAEMTDAHLPISLKSSSFDIILDIVSGTIFYKSPFFKDAGLDVPADAWLKLDGVQSLFEGEDTVKGDITIGGLIWEEALGYSYYSQIEMYDELIYTADSYREILGDDMIKQNGNDYTLTIKDEYMDELAEVILTIKTDGSVITAVTGGLAVKVTDSYYGVLIAASFNLDASGMDLSFELHIRNTMKLQLDIVSKNEPYTGEIPKAPPEGDTVVAIDDTYVTYETEPSATPII